MQTTTELILTEEKLFGKHFMIFFSFLFHNNMVYYVKIVKTLEDASMKGKITNSLGDILIDENVIAKYAGTTAVECFGIVGMAAVSMTDGLVKLLKKDSITKGIDVEIDEANNITIDFHVIVSYGVNISSVTDNLVENVKYKVEAFTGLKIAKINIFVEGVRIID